VLRANSIEDVAYEKKADLKLRYINNNDLKKMMEMPMTDPMIELVRRAFIFSALIGLAYTDIYGLYPRHIGKASDGRMYICICRTKTNVEAFILLHLVVR